VITLPKLVTKLSPNYSSRNAAISLIVLHDTEGGYQGAIATFMNHHAEVSAHLVLREDGAECTQMVPYAEKAWACCAFNSVSLNLEMAGFIAKGYSAAEWTEAASITAYLAHRYDVPLRWAKTGHEAGICRHRDLGKAGGGHTDPCDDATFAKFLDHVQSISKGAEWPLDKWGQ
jgi:N-acetyl-anhydromuramyl-L-alanine amidase AmpD